MLNLWETIRSRGQKAFTVTKLIIDLDFRGELLVALHNDSNQTQVVRAGDRIAQLVVQPYVVATIEEVEELTNTVRGKGGLGSTGV